MYPSTDEANHRSCTVRGFGDGVLDTAPTFGEDRSEIDAIWTGSPLPMVYEHTGQYAILPTL